MATRDRIVIGASAGGVQALQTLVADLPPDLPAAVFIVLHISADFPSLLPQILARQSTLDVAHAIDGEPIQTGRIYVAPPDEHLIIEDKRVKLVHGKRPLTSPNRLNSRSDWRRCSANTASLLVNSARPTNASAP